MKNERLIAIITQQQKGHENEPIFMVGEQLKDIAENEPAYAELLEKDLTVSGMKLKDAADALQKYADEHHGKATRFCIPPHTAEKILREFYGLPEGGSVPVKDGPSEDMIDITAFL